jgi:hypothetical protein
VNCPQSLQSELVIVGEATGEREGGQKAASGLRNRHWRTSLPLILTQSGAASYPWHRIAVAKALFLHKIPSRARKVELNRESADARIVVFGCAEEPATVARLAAATLVAAGAA